jgi:hypothetical protein
MLPCSARPRNNGVSPIPTPRATSATTPRSNNLFVLTNLESLNPVLVRQGLAAPERLLRLNEIAITQMRTLLADSGLKRLKE